MNMKKLLALAGAGSRVITKTSLILAFALAAGGNAEADTLYSSGTKTWDTSTANWGTGPGGPYNTVTWNNSTPDSAVFEGTAGTVTLAEAINIRNLTVSNFGYTIRSNTLNFASGGTITNSHSANGNVYITCGITGSPNVYANGGYGVGDPWSSYLYLSPTSGVMTLGTITRPRDNRLVLGGTTTGNSLISNGGGKVHKVDTGTWTVGNVTAQEFTLDNGVLVVTGKLASSDSTFTLNGGVLHCNNPGVFGAPGPYIFAGSSLDNSSGAAITNSTANKAYNLNANLTFIGSLGANSDLNLGTGAVTMNASRTVTVSNAAATLTIGGAITDGVNTYGLTKAGDGMLKLLGTNTYDGETVVNAGTLSLKATCLSDIAAVRIAAGATLNLDYVGTDTVFQVYTNGVVGPTGTWGGLGSGADNQTALITGTGRLNAPVPTVLAGIRYWDGGTTNIPGTGNAVSEGAGGTWSTSIKNWDCGAGVAYTNWNNSTNDLAIFGGAGATVNLAENIYLGGILINNFGYTIRSNTLHFAPGGAITNNHSANGSVTITCGITGSPNVYANGGYGSGNPWFSSLYLSPTSGDMTLGTISRPQDNNLYLGGTTTGNSLVSTGGKKVRKADAGTWTVSGALNPIELWIEGGTLVANGSTTLFTTLYSNATLVINGTLSTFGTFNSGGTLKGTGTISAAVSVPAGGTLAPGYPTGTLTVTNNNCTINGNLGITLAGAQNSKLAVFGTLNVANATLNVTVSEMPTVPVVIATYNSLVQPFAAINGAGKFTIDYHYKGSNAIVLVPPPAGTIISFF